MVRVIPSAARVLLNFIGDIEAPQGYDTIYGNNQSKLDKPITKMTLDELIVAQPSFTNRFKSSASGRYQFMMATLKDLKRTEMLDGRQVFSPAFQDELGLALLERRGYSKWRAGSISDTQFMINLAKEWASLPVPVAMAGQHRQLTAGQSYYAGDALNKSLVSVAKFQAALAAAREAGEIASKAQKDAQNSLPSTPEPTAPEPTAPETPPKLEPVKMPKWRELLVLALETLAGLLKK